MIFFESFFENWFFYSDTKSRDQKDSFKNDSIAKRSTRSDTHNDLAGDGINVAESGAFSNFPDIPEKSVENMKK